MSALNIGLQWLHRREIAIAWTILIVAVIGALSIAVYLAAWKLLVLIGVFMLMGLIIWALVTLIAHYEV